MTKTVVQRSIVLRGTVEAARTVTVSGQASTEGGGMPVLTAIMEGVGKEVGPAQVILEASGRPVVALPGDKPAFRDLTPCSSGYDVVQFQNAVRSLGISTGGAADGEFGEGTKGRQRSRAFRTKAEADRYRSRLLVAQQSGERFDHDTGEPVSWQPLPDEIQAHDWARRWLAEQWNEWAPRTRASAVEAITRLLPLLVSPTAPEPPAGLRAHLRASLPPDGVEVDDEAAAWLVQWSLQFGQLSRAVLATVDQALGVGDDGAPLGPATAGRFRQVSRACIRRAVDLGVLESDPWPPAPRGRSQRKAGRARRSVAVRALPDPETMRQVIDAIPNHQPASRTYQVMTAIAYYAGLRPSEVVMLRAKALHLPARGWGRIDVTEADVSFDEPGEPKTGPRSVPVPRPLVEMLRAWVADGGFRGDDLLFRTRAGGRPTSSNWSRSMRRALEKVDHPPMRIYDCRHAAATTWLTAGVPLGEVAKRMGHSVETLVSTYVGALDGDEAVANQRIDAVLGRNVPRRKSGRKG